MDAFRDALNNMKDNMKDKEMIVNALKRIKNKGENIKEFMWKTMRELCFENNDEIKEFMWKTMSELCYKNDDEINNNFDDEKKNNNNNIKNKQIKISQLIDIKNDQVCKYGHETFRDDKQLILDNKCTQCSSMNGRKYCLYCVKYDQNDAAAQFHGYGVNSSDVKRHIYCMNCRKTNSENIRKRVEMNKIKSDIIRKELINYPTLERDLLCNMQRRAAVDELIYDINKLSIQDRANWTLLCFDMDYLKAWNTALGHISTDKLIKQIGNIMHKYVNEINNGKWTDKNDTWKETHQSLLQAFIYRTGGDEFVMVIKCEDGVCGLPNFYKAFKSEINLLGSTSNIKELVNKNEWKETEQKLNNATDRNGNKINLNIVGLSCGIFIPSGYKSSVKDWLSITDKIALEKAKKSNGIEKNGCAIFYEKGKKIVMM